MVNAMETNSQIKKIQVPTNLHPLENAAQVFLKELQQLCIDTSHGDDSVQGVLLLQKDSTANFSEAWLNELRNVLLLDELVQRIHLLRNVCQKIRQSRITWMYAAAGNTCGGFFEIAFACHKRFWFDSNAVVGFPEIESGAFPGGGTIEILNEQQRVDAAEWAKDAFVSVQRALERDWADFVGDARDWEGYAEAWLANLLAQPNRSLKTQQKLEPYSPPNYNQSSASLQKSDLWSGDHGFSDKLFNAWEAGWKVLRAKARERSKVDQDNLFVYFAARHYLSAAYMIWVRRDSWKSDRAHQANRVVAPDARVAYVNLNESLVPPARPLARLLREGYLVVLVGDSSRSLKGNLELLYGRFERILPANELHDLWQRGISWIVSEDRLTNPQTILEWTSDERLVIQPGRPDEAKFIRLEGNKGSAASGWCEFVQINNKAPDQASLALATVMSNGIIYTRPVGTASLPVSMYVRSLFFEEMLRVAGAHPGGLNVVLDELRATGWGFAATHSSWDYFLIHREGDFSMSPTSLALGGKGLEAFAWQIGHWRSAVNYVNQQPKNAAKMHSQELSLHFAIYAGVITRMLVKHGHVRSDFDGDTLVKSCLGFPAFHGTPLSLMELRGANRVLYHCQRHWPELVPEVVTLTQTDAK